MQTIVSLAVVTVIGTRVVFKEVDSSQWRRYSLLRRAKLWKAVYKQEDKVLQTRTEDIYACGGDVRVEIRYL